MITFLYIVGILAAILLVLVILIQNPKGGGLASNFSSSNSVLGVQKTTEIIEKLTWGLAAVLLVVSLGVTMGSPKVTGDAAPAVEQGTLLDDATVPVVPGNNGLPADGSQSDQGNGQQQQVNPAQNGENAAPLGTVDPNNPDE